VELRVICPVCGLLQSHAEVLLPAYNSGATFDCLLLLFYFGEEFTSVKYKHYATNRQVAGSIPDGVIGIFL
jgi:hypothetical protein